MTPAAHVHRDGEKQSVASEALPSEAHPREERSSPALSSDPLASGEAFESPRNRARILLVEDDALIRENLAEILELEGYDVATAIDGLDALERLQHEPLPDLVITDLQMPRANGWVLGMELRREPRLAKLPLVVISGVHDSRSAGGFLGAAATFQKPFDVPEFLETLSRLIHASRPGVHSGRDD